MNSCFINKLSHDQIQVVGLQSKCELVATKNCASNIDKKKHKRTNLHNIFAP